MHKTPISLLVVFVALTAVFVYFRLPNSSDCVPTTMLMLRGETRITVAVTPQEQEKGLSGHAPLAKDEGMLFQFATPAKRGFWMKEMLFPIDIIWLDGDLRVLSFFEDVRPDSYPKSYDSPSDMQYALEVAVGTVSSRGIAVGDHATRELRCGR
jgi:uncharacterized protein